MLFEQLYTTIIKYIKQPKLQKQVKKHSCKKKSKKTYSKK